MGYVYFVEASELNRIKIGWAKAPDARLSTLQCGSPSILVRLGVIPGGLALERRIHERFAPLRVTGEWFTGTEELRAYIAQNAQPWSRPEKPPGVPVPTPPRPPRRASRRSASPVPASAMLIQGTSDWLEWLDSLGAAAGANSRAATLDIALAELAREFEFEPPPHRALPPGTNRFGVPGRAQDAD